MKKLFTILSLFAALAFVGCTDNGGDDIGGNNDYEGSYSIDGAIQKGPFVQGSDITIQSLNAKLKPIGQMYTTQTINDAGMFEMDEINSKYAEIIASGYYFDEVEGKISSGMLTLRSITDLADGTQTNVNLLTSLTYNRIKNLVTKEGKEVAEAQSQAEKELFTALGIPQELQPNVSCGAMNIANDGEGDGLLLALSAILQEGRSTGELTEYISKFATDLADDGKVSAKLVEKFNLDGQHLMNFEERIKDNLRNRYNDLNIECKIPEFEQYLPYFSSTNNPYYVIPFTYFEDKNEALPGDPEFAISLKGIEDKFIFVSDVEFLGYEYNKGYGEIYLSAAPTVITSCNCDVLRTIEIPNSVIEIGYLAFETLCLRTLNIPDSVTTIGAEAFITCLFLDNITIGKGVTSIGDYAFSGVGLMSLMSPMVNITDIAAWCNIEFASAYSNPLTSIQHLSINGEENPTLVIPDNVTKISDYAFSHCLSFREVTIGKNVTSIGKGAFVNCVDLANITISQGVSTIGDGAFEGCHSLTNITIPEGVTTIGAGAFAGTGLKSITIPESITSIKGAFYACSELAEFKGKLASADGRCLIMNDVLCSFAPAGITKYTLPDGVSKIEDGTFMYCRKLKSLKLSNSTTSIGEQAFYGCSELESINIPKTVTYIGELAFYDCSNLNEVHITDVAAWCNIDFSPLHSNPLMFARNLYLNNELVTNLIIPDGVTSISCNAFCACINLVSVTIPNSVTKIGDAAFRWCENLESVYCKPLVPPTLEHGSSAFYDNSLNRKIYVQYDRVKTYEEALGWNGYASDIVGYDFSE